MGKGITRQRSGYLLQELFQVLLENPEGIQAKDALAQLSKRVQLTDHEAGTYDSGTRRFERIVRFATVDVVKAGWMRKSKGIWTITPEGQNALDDFSDPASFHQEATRLYRKWKKEQDAPADDDEEPTPSESAAITLEEAEEQAWSEISSYLQQIDPYELQALVASLLDGMDYHVSWISPPGKDGGLDIIAFTDPLGTKPPRIKVQVKRRKDNIPVEELRAFLALVNRDDVGIFVTTGGFTKDAEELARGQETRKITLISGAKLVELWIEYQERIPASERDALPLRPVYFLSPAN